MDSTEKTILRYELKAWVNRNNGVKTCFRFKIETGLDGINSNQFFDGYLMVLLYVEFLLQAFEHKFYLL